MPLGELEAAAAGGRGLGQPDAGSGRRNAQRRDAVVPVQVIARDATVRVTDLLGPRIDLSPLLAPGTELNEVLSEEFEPTQILGDESIASVAEERDDEVVSDATAENTLELAAHPTAEAVAARVEELIELAASNGQNLKTYKLRLRRGGS